MKKYLLSNILLVAAFFVAQNISAYDFSENNENGVPIYYNVLSEADKTCEVTWKEGERGLSSSKSYTDYVGDVKIPATTNSGYRVTRIGNYAFVCCKSLTSVSFPNSITSFETGAFYYCTGLTSIVIPNSVYYIGQFAFDGCSSVTSLTLGESVTSIGTCAFFDCKGLTSVIIPNSVTVIGRQAFQGCLNLTSVEIGNKVKSLLGNAFCDCKSLTSITLPESITSIEESVFHGCTGLTSVVIPNSVTSIGSSVFYGCRNLESIKSYITDVFQTGSNAFTMCYNATLYVPAGLKSTYQSTSDWNKISKIEEIPGVSLALACSDQGKVSINDYITFTNKLGEVTVFDGTESKFVFTSEEGSQLERVLINGLDVTRSVKDNLLKITIYPNYSMMVIFAPKGADVNRDGAVDISDVVALVNIILGQ